MMHQTLFRLPIVDSPSRISSRLHNTSTETAIRGNLIDCSMSNESMRECLYMDSHNEYRVGSMDVDMMRDGTAWLVSEFVLINADTVKFLSASCSLLEPRHHG